MADHPEAKRGPDDASITLGVSVFLGAIVWLAFSQTLRHGFVNYDDNAYIYQNPTVLAGLTWRGFLWAFTFAEIGHWHPVTWFSHMVDCWLFGLRSGGHHLTNVALHATAVILLFLALKQMTGAICRSAVVAALFAIHPQRVESVAWIAERKDVLSGVFFMATLIAYTRWVRGPSRARYLLIVVLFALGLMSKGMLVTLPFVLLLLDYWPLGRFTSGNRASRWRLLTEKIPLFALSAASCVATSLSPERVPAALQMSLSARLENVVVSYVIYLKQMLNPVDLVLPYFNPPGGFPLAQVILALVLLIGVSVGAFLLRKNHPPLLVGWLWYLGMMTPVIGLVQISYYARADRYTYLPHIGLYLFATWGMAELFRRWRLHRAIPAVAALVVVALLTTQTHALTSKWRDSETLWRYVLVHTPDNFIACNNLGLVLEQKGKLEDALALYERARKTQPAYVETYNNMGNALVRLGRVRDAIAQYQHALELLSDLPHVHNNLGTALAQDGQLTQAIAHFHEALKISPDFGAAHGNLGYAFLLEGDLDEALRELQRALELLPNSIEAHRHLAEVFLKQGRTADAIAHYRKVVELNPDDAEARRKLAELLPSAS